MVSEYDSTKGCGDLRRDVGPKGGGVEERVKTGRRGLGVGIRIRQQGQQWTMQAIALAIDLSSLHRQF